MCNVVGFLEYIFCLHSVMLNNVSHFCYEVGIVDKGSLLYLLLSLFRESEGRHLSLEVVTNNVTRKLPLLSLTSY